MSTKNPFSTGTWMGHEMEAVDTDSRIRMVRNFNKDQCQRALLVTGVQKTVADAIHRRLRKLQRGEK